VRSSVLDAALRRCAAAGNAISMLALVAMTLLTFVDVTGRYLFNHPLLGAFETSEITLVLLVFGCLAYTEHRSGHVDIDILVSRFPARERALAEGLAALLSAVFWGAIAWRTALHALDVHRAGETSAILKLPVATVVGIAAIGSTLFALALAARMLGALRHVSRR